MFTLAASSALLSIFIFAADSAPIRRLAAHAILHYYYWWRAQCATWTMSKCSHYHVMGLLSAKTSMIDQLFQISLLINSPVVEVCFQQGKTLGAFSEYCEY